MRHNGALATMATQSAHQSKIESVQALRGIAAIAVVFFHTYQFELDPRYFGQAPMGGFWAWGMHGIDLFFVISGFIMAHVHFDDFIQGIGWRRFFVARVSRIYAPYLPVLAILAVAYFAVAGLGSESGVDVRDPLTILRSAILWPGTNGLLPVAWTLEHEIVFYFVVMIALMRPAIGVVLFVGWQLYALTAGHGGSDFAKFLMGPYEIEFAFGIGCMQIVRHFPVTNYPRLILGAGSFLFFALALYTTYVHDFVPVTYVSTISYGLASSVVLVGAVYCERAGYVAIPWLASFVSGASYSIYLVHYPLISLLSKLLVRFGLARPELVNVGFVGLSITSIAAGCLYHVAVERQLTAVARNLLQRALDRGWRLPRSPRTSLGRIDDLVGSNIPSVLQTSKKA